MNASLKWLNTLVDISGLDPEEMAETLTVDGIPVEHVIYPGEGIHGVVTGKILSTLWCAGSMWDRKRRCRS